jgi:hypothetical protein
MKYVYTGVFESVVWMGEEKSTTKKDRKKNQKKRKFQLL